MSFLSWIELQGKVYMVTDHDVHCVSKMAEHVDPLGHDVIREVHTLPSYYEAGSEWWEPRFWEPFRYPATIQPFLKNAETITHTWGKLIGCCMKEEGVRYVMKHAPMEARRLVVDMLYDAVLTQLNVERARLALCVGRSWHLLPKQRMLLTDLIEHGDYDPDRAAGRKIFRASPA